MLQIIKANMHYTFQHKFNISFQILGFVYIAIVSYLYAPRYCRATNLQDVPEMPLAIFLFVMTFMFISTPLLKAKNTQISFSHFILSFPITKWQLASSHFIKLLLLKVLIIMDVILFSWIALIVQGVPVTGEYVILIALFIVYASGITGSLYILLYFISKWFDVLIYVLYFAIFFTLTLPLKFNWLVSSEYRFHLLIGGFLFMLVTYFVSLVAISHKDF